MKEKKKVSKKKGKDISIRWKLTIYMAVFTLFALLVVWVFQLLLLDRFYEITKSNELYESVVTLSRNIDDMSSLRVKANEVFANTGVYTAIFRMGEDGNTVEEFLSGTGDCYIKTASQDEKTSIFNNVSKSGTYRMTTQGKTVNGREMIYGIFVEAENGRSYVVVVDSFYKPVKAVAKTLNLQFACIAVILLTGAVILGYIISIRISTPLVRMNESAKKLALGNYNADFKGEGCLETHELAETLNYASMELMRTDELKKEIIANVSHDLRTPLTMITGYSEVMRDIPGENTPENIQVIIDESTRLTGLVNDILDLSKIQSGAFKFEKSVFDITDTVRATMLRYTKLKEHDGYKVEFTADENVFVSADRDRILQVIYNLINNALNYAGEDKTVTVIQTVKNGKVRISVRDNGEGIKPEELNMIWDRYYKVDKVHKRAVVGTGLGLSIVKGILEAHGTDYGAESEYGKGSTFWFELDMVE